MPAKTEVMMVIATAGVAIESISLGLLGVLYAVYSQFAQPDEQGRRLPVLRPLRITARLVVIFAAFNALVIGLSILWFTTTDDDVFYVTLGLFIAELVVAPILAVYLVFRLFK